MGLLQTTEHRVNSVLLLLLATLHHALGNGMESTEFYKWGGSIPPEQLTVPYALSLYNVVAKFPFATLLDVCRQDGVEILILEFQVELPQYPPIPILRQERIAIELSSDENVAPKIFALRRSFPETPHQNLTYAGTPKSLCLFDQFYVDIKADLSPIKLLIRIGDWLRRAAIDELHQPGQPLEPFLLSRDSIIFHEDIFDTFATDSLAITVVHTLAVDPVILRAFRPGDPASQYASENSRYVLLPITAQPRYSNLIHYQPRHLLELTELLNEVQINLVDELCKLVVRVEKSGGVRQLAQYKPIILLKIPKIRTIGGSVEGMEWWAFLLQNSLEELSIKLGIKAKSDTGYLVPLITADPPLGLESVSIAVLRPTFALSRSIAQLLSGEIENKSHIMAIGAGALGSQIILNLAKQGFGIWTIVDEDRLLPHNFSRHGLTCWIYEAQDKSKALSTEIQNLLNDSAAAQSFTLNILNHRNNDELSATFDACNVIVDFSASRTVMRFLAKLEYPARRLSAF